MKNNAEIIIIETPGQSVQVRLEGETVWLSQAQMAELFGTSGDNISLHLKNIYKEQELLEAATTEDFSVVRTEGKRQVQRCRQAADCARITPCNLEKCES